jgi:predicted metal-dependent peptidase
MTDDIKSVLLRIKENISAVEMDGPSTHVLEEIDRDFRRLMELIKLFLISERDSYYGFILMNMSFRANFAVNGIAGILLNEFPPVFESNPLLLCKFALREIIYVVCHEIDHVVLNHPAEMVKLGHDDPDLLMKFNLAADAAVNDRINDEIKARRQKFLAQPEGLITSKTLAEMFKLKSVARSENYLYYFELIKDKKNPSQQQSQPQRMMGQLGGPGGPGGDKDDKDTRSVVTVRNAGQLKDHDWQLSGDEEDARAAVRELVNAAVDMMNEEARGLMPGFFMSQVKVLNQPPRLTWQQILKKYVGTISAEKRRTRTRLNRRQPERFDLSGSMDSKVLKIVVAIDTSASVDDRMIASIINEIFGIIAKRRHEITVLECDAQVQRVYQVNKPSDVQAKVVGRGGTAFSPAIEYINNERYFRDALMIYFTDGYGESRIPKPRTYRNIWVVFGDESNLSVKEPYGTVIALKR